MDQIEERQSPVAIALGDRNDEAKVRLHHLRFRRFVTAFDALRKRDFLRGRPKLDLAESFRKRLQTVGRRFRNAPSLDIPPLQVEEGAGAPRNPLLVVALYSAIILLEIASTEVPLRVAILASISWRVPPRRYGPWEQFASLLTEGLVRRGVDVTLFATADSITRARLVGTAPTGYSEDPGLHAKAWEALHISSVFERADEFDVIHNSFDFLPLTYAALVDTPVVTTIHGFSSEQIVPVYEKYNEHGYYVAISDADRHDRLDYAATIHHGIDLDEFELQQQAGKYLLFFGRIHPDKGTAEAIDVAERVGMPLTIAGIIQDRDYFERFVEPRLDGENVRYVGPIGPDRRGTVLGGALALLHLVNFDEPFGFSVVEAMACGTPVIAQRRGSMVEIVEDGENGFLVEALDEAVSAVAACAKLDRSRVRASVETRFDVDRMVDDYLALYRQVAAAHAPVVPLPTERFRVGVNYWPVRRR